MTTGAASGLMLVVEDEPAVADLQRLYLARAGFGVHVERTAREGLTAVRRLRPVAVVLDLGLPDGGGLDVLAALREEHDWTPVLLVTARGEEEDRLRGLAAGADDYLAKPFSPRELVARVQAVLRRSSAPPGPPAAAALGPLVVDPAAHRVLVDGEEVATTPTEFALLAFLAGRPGQVVGRDELLSKVWGYAAAGGTRTVDVHVAQLRGKLGAAAVLLRTVRGVGYVVDLPSGSGPP